MGKFWPKVYPILWGENDQNKPENQQNWNMAKIKEGIFYLWACEFAQSLQASAIDKGLSVLYSRSKPKDIFKENCYCTMNNDIKKKKIGKIGKI